MSKKKIIIIVIILLIVLISLISYLCVIKSKANRIEQLTIDYSFNVRPKGFTDNARFTVDTEKYENGNIVSEEHEDVYVYVGKQKEVKIVKYGEDASKPTEITFINFKNRGDKENTYNNVTVIDMINNTYKTEDDYSFVLPNQMIEKYIASSFDTFNTNDFNKIAIDGDYKIYDKDGFNIISNHDSMAKKLEDNITFQLDDKKCILEYEDYDSNDSYTLTRISTNLEEEVKYEDAHYTEINDYIKVEEE